ncbi:putative EF-hand domain-containing protein [Helianthus debilis subsp. tardiflorus]
MSFMIVDLIQYFRDTGIYLFASQHSKVPLEKTTHDPILSKTHLSFTNNKTTFDNHSVHGDDLELLMVNLGVSGCCEKLPEVLNTEDVFNIFEEEEPRLDEVKEAFDVFDENKDGFIDVQELQRVMLVLGLKERMEIEDCRRMIRAFDENADGRIDFNEFVKLMEDSFC